MKRSTRQKSGNAALNAEIQNKAESLLTRLISAVSKPIYVMESLELKVNGKFVKNGLHSTRAKSGSEYGAWKALVGLSSRQSAIRLATVRKEGHGQDFGLVSSSRSYSRESL